MDCDVAASVGECRCNSLHIIMIKLFWYENCLPVQWEPTKAIRSQNWDTSYSDTATCVDSSLCTCQWPVVNSLNTHITCQLWLAWNLPERPCSDFFGCTPKTPTMHRLLLVGVILPDWFSPLPEGRDPVVPLKATTDTIWYNRLHPYLPSLP